MPFSMLALGILLAGADPANDEIIKDLTRLQGPWLEARPGSTPRPDKGVFFLVFKEDRILSVRSFLDRDEKIQTKIEDFARFTINPSQTPKAIDLTMVSGPSKGKLVRASYIVVDEKLELLLPLKPEDPRPTTRMGAMIEYFVRPPKPEDVEKMAGEAKRLLDNLQNAKPLDRSKFENTLELEINQEGQILAPADKAWLKSPDQLQDYLQKKKDKFLAEAEAKGDKSGKLKVMITISADRKVKYLTVDKVMQKCKDLGFHSLQIRVKTGD